MNLSTSSSNEGKLLKKRLTGFLLVAILILVILSMIVKNTIIKTVCDSRYFKLPPESKTLIMGDSYLMTGLVPEMFPNTLNAAKRAEPLPFTYEKLKFIFNNNPQIENIILSLSYTSMTDRRLETLTERVSVKYFSESYFRLYDKELSKLTFVPTGPYFSSWFKYRMGIPFEISKELGDFLRIKAGIQPYHYYPFWGGFKIMPQTTTNKNLAKRIDIHFDSSGADVEFPNILIDYFQRIINYCYGRGIVVLAVNTPKLAGYDKMVPEDYKRALQEIVQEMKAKYDGFRYLDYSKMEMEPKFMRDADHLNYEGAKIFSGILYQDIKPIITKGADYDN